LSIIVVTLLGFILCF